MPIHRVDGKWQWGQHGAKYATRAGAERQAAAAYAHGYRGDESNETARQAKAFENGEYVKGRDRAKLKTRRG